MISPAIEELIEAFQCLPGVGAKTAQRMVFHLLSGRRQQGSKLSRALEKCISTIQYCHNCRIFCENEQCNLCKNPKRDRSQICIVQSPADVIAFEQTSRYRGLYFVLHGVLSPIDGITPQKLGLNQFQEKLGKGEIKEVIVATHATAEGEATAHYVSQNTKKHPHVSCSRLAYGIPHGGEFEYLDSTTLAQALAGRREVL